MDGKKFGEFLGLSEIGLPDGNKVRIALFQTDRAGPAADIPRHDIEGSYEWLGQWLKENPKKVEGWMNVYQGGATDNGVWCDTSSIWSSRETADRKASLGRLACIPISYHIGQGLESDKGEESE